MFESVYAPTDARTDGRRLDAYPISSAGSGEIKMNPFCSSEYMLKIESGLNLFRITIYHH